MKKLLILLTAVIACAAFMRGFWLNDEMQISYAEFPPYQVVDETGSSPLRVSISLEDFSDANTRERLLNLLEKSDCNVYTGDSVIRNDGRIYQLAFIQNNSQKPLFSFDTLEGDKVIFDNDSQFLSSDPNNEERTGTVGFTNKENYADYKTVYEIKPLSAFREHDREGESVIFYVFSENPEQFIEAINSETWPDSMVFNLYELEGSNLPEQPEYMDTILIFSVLALLIVFMIMMYRKAKEVMIQKLYGKPAWKIFLRSAAPDLITMLAVFAGCLVVLYFLSGGNFYALHANLRKYLLQYFLLFLAGLAVIGLVSYGFAAWIHSSGFLKGEGAKVHLSVLGLLLKLAFVFSILPFFSSSFNLAMTEVDQLIMIVSNKDKTTGNIALGPPPTGNNDDRESYIDMTNSENILFMSEDIFYSVGMDGMYSSDYWYMKTRQPKIYVNTKMANYLGILDENGQTMTFEENQRYLLIPEGTDYYDENEEEVFKDLSLRHTVQKNQLIVSPSLYGLEGDLRRMYYNPVICVTCDVRDRAVFGIFTENFYLGEDDQSLREMYNKYGFKRYFWCPTTVIYEQTVHRIGMKVIKDLALTLLILLLIAVFQYQSIFLFLEENQNLLAVQTMMGKKAISKYIGLIAGNLLIVILPLLIWYGYFRPGLDFFWLISAVLIVMDLLICLLAIRNFEKKRVTPVLKGEEV